MKLLLLSDIPPCSDLTAGLVLAQLCRFIPEGSLASFIVLNQHLSPKPFADLAWIPTRTVQKPSEMGVYRRNGMPIGAPGAFGIETYKRLALTPKLVKAAAKFAREQRIDAIWAILQGQTIIRMAAPLARELKVPLYSQVWDPLSWWLKAHNVDPINKRLAHRDFDRALKASRACAAASWAMAEHYQRTYSAPSTPVIASHDSVVALRPAPRLRNDDELVIGMAGQFYASEEWGQLVYALRQAGWRVGSRKVKLKVLGRDAPAGELPPDVVDYLGWQKQEDAVRLLSEQCDVLYCPYPFAPPMEEVSRLSFPSKLSTYFAAGRPVLFHGPDYASPAVYLRKHDAGYVCNDLYPAAVYNGLLALTEQPELYARLAANGQNSFARDFTFERMRASFHEFLGDTAAALERGPERAPSPMRKNLVRKAFSGARRAAWRALVPRRIERRVVLASPEYLELAGRHNRLGEQLGEVDASRGSIAEQLRGSQRERDGLGQQLRELGSERDRLLAELRELEADATATHAANVERIADLERTIAEHRAMQTAHLEHIARLEQSVTEHQSVQAAQLEHVARLERTIAEQVATHAAGVARISGLEHSIAQREAQLVALRQEAAAVRNECTELRGQATALRIANDNQTALITGKLSLIEYRMQSLVVPARGGRTTALSVALYLDLLEAALVGVLTGDPPASPWSGGKFDANIRAIGRDWPQHAQTMIGTARMRNLRHLLERVIAEGIPGDVIETGVWRGGACIYMRGVLAAHGVTDRTVWVADSFCGLPLPDEAAFPADRGDKHHTFDQLAVSLAEVKRNFERYGLLDERVRFLEGWFKDTLPSAPIERLALLRLDGDMYESTIEALDALYSKVSDGGFVIVDDYILEPCRKAVEDFRVRHGITAELEPVDGAAVFWKKDACNERVTATSETHRARTEEVPE